MFQGFCAGLGSQCLREGGQFSHSNSSNVVGGGDENLHSSTSFSPGDTVYPPFLDTAKNHVDELPVSRTIRNKPAGQHGDTDPTGASSSAGGVGEEKKKGAEAETLGAQGCWLCREHLLSTYYVWGWGEIRGEGREIPRCSEQYSCHGRG